MPPRYYLGNPNLKAENVPIEWTPELLDEYDRCHNDPIYFIRNYMWIIHLDKGLVKFDLYDYQEDLILTYTNERRVIVLSSRQSGKSISTIGFFLHYILFNTHKVIAILANKGDSARGLLERLKLAYEKLPFFLQQGIKEWNKGNIKLENGSEIIAGSTSNSAVRSKSINILFLDEFAFVEPNLAEAFFKSSYPTISAGETTKIIIVSTANGMNHYFKMWSDAEEGRSNYTPIRVDWWQVPGRDEKWKEETIRATSQEQFDQEYGNEFLGSAGTLISPNTLRLMQWKVPISDKNSLKIYKKPEKDRKYAITFDASEGDGLDYQCFSVSDITEIPYEQVAVYRDNEVDVHLMSDIIYSVGNYYNEAYVLIELNEHGAIVADSLYMDLEYENIMFVTVSGRSGQILGGGFSGKTRFGLKQSKTTKRIGCASLKSMLESGQYIINDFDTISELSAFVRDKKGSYSAQEGYNDDTCMTLVLFGWIIKQKYFKDEMQQDIKANIQDDHVTQILDMLAPVGYFHDGTEDIEEESKLKNGMVWPQ